MPFQKANRAGTKALIGLYAESGGGKTYSALMLARGLVGPEGLVMMIDTENRRGEMYSDVIPQGYQVQQMQEPFSSSKYSEMIREAEVAADGRKAALVIDSFSHEWEGIGGVLNAAETISENRAKRFNSEWNGQTSFGDWKEPKQAHKRMMLQMLGSNLHIICCLRAQYASHQIERADFEKYGIKSKGKTAVIRDDFQTPIQDKNFIFEMMLHIEMSNKQAGVPIIRKCPEMLLPALQKTRQLSVETGAAIAEWVEGGGVETKSESDLRDEGKASAAQGLSVYQEWFVGLPNSDRLTLTNSGDHEDFKATAREVDEMREH